MNQIKLHNYYLISKLTIRDFLSTQSSDHLGIVQGSYGSCLGKPWKVIKFYNFNFQALKVMEFESGS